MSITASIMNVPLYSCAITMPELKLEQVGGYCTMTGWTHFLKLVYHPLISYLIMSRTPGEGDTTVEVV